MDQKIKDLWAKNKLLCILLFIPIVILMFREQIINLLLRSSRKIASDAQKTDDALAQQQAAQQAQGQALKQQGDDLGSKPKPPVTEDWNKQ